MDILVSIIVPIYNVEQYLSECLDSIINQTYSNIEIILVNDESTDKCEDICNKYLLLDKRIKYYKKKNGGLSSARNYGIKKSHGEYICFIDSDDYIDKDYVKKLLEFSVSNNCDITVCGYKEFDNNHQKNKKYINRYPSDIRNNRVITEREVWNEWWLNRKNFDDYAYAVIFTKLFKKTLFKKYRFKNIFHEDEFAFIKIYHLAKKIGVIDDLLYYYRKNRFGSIMYHSLQNENNRKFIIFKFSIERTVYFIKNKFPLSIINAEKKYNNWLEHYFSIPKFYKFINWCKVRRLIKYYKKNNLIDDACYKKYLKSQFKPFYFIYKKVKSFSKLKKSKNKIKTDLLILGFNKKADVNNIILAIKQYKIKFKVVKESFLHRKKINVLYVNNLNLNDLLKKKDSVFREKTLITDDFDCLKTLKENNLIDSFYIDKKNYIYHEIFKSQFDELTYLIGRVLLYLEFINFNTFLQVNKDSFNLDNYSKICINLPESIERRISFDKNGIKNITYFPAIKHKIGWLGCALTYKLLSSLLIKCNEGYFQIFEDDVIVKKDYFKNINSLMSFAKDNSIDLLCCYTTWVVPYDMKRKILKINNLFLINQHALVSEVFNIYSKKFLKMMSLYDENAVDKENNVYYQMDQYTSRNCNNMKIYLVVPYLVNHSPDLISDINKVKNSELCYNKDADNTERQILNLSKKYYRKK